MAGNDIKNGIYPDVNSILDFVPVRIFWKDVNLRYLGCNQKFAEDAGLASPKQIVGKTDFELCWPDQAEMYRSDDSKVIESGKAKISYEESQQRADGSVSWLQTSKQPLTHCGETIGVVGTYNDITQHRADRMAAQNKGHFETVGRMTAGIAHDFNNILTPICAYAEILTQRLPDNSNLRPHKSIFDRAINHAHALSKQLLLQSTKSVPQRQLSCPNEVIQNLLPMLRRLCRSDITIETDLQKLAQRIEMSSLRLERVIINLATNARDAMPNGGTIVITTAITGRPEKAIGQSIAKANSWLYLTVSDTGTGIPKENQARIFDHFVSSKEFNSQSSSKDNGKASLGAGLGLAICNDIIETAGGCISVDSQPGMGTEFQIYVPFANS